MSKENNVPTTERGKQLRPVARGAAPSGLDRAYGCFAWIAFVICAVALFSVLVQDNNTRNALGMLIGIPFALTAVAAGVVGLVLSVVHWREWPLLLMSAVVASMILAFLAKEEWNLVGEGFVDAWCTCATAVLIFFCARWFAFTRSRATRAQATGEQGP